MTDLKKAAQQALEALEGLFGLPNQWESGGVAVWRLGGSDAPRQAITALRTALAMHQVSEFAQAQEQQAEPSQWRDMVVVNLVREGVNKHKARELADHFAAPPQRQWVGLEAEDLAQIESDEFWQVGNHMAIALAVEAKLKERNHD